MKLPNECYGCKKNYCPTCKNFKIRKVIEGLPEKTNEILNLYQKDIENKIKKNKKLKIKITGTEGSGMSLNGLLISRV